MLDANLQDISIVKLVSGIAGSFASVRFIQGGWLERLIMCIGGSCLSYYATTPVATWVGLQAAEGLVGFLIGLFGMSIAAKVYEIIGFLDADRAAKEFWDWLSRKWKA